MFSVVYASGTSIAKFPKDGIVITKNLKDQGNHSTFSNFTIFSFF